MNGFTANSLAASRTVPTDATRNLLSDTGVLPVPCALTAPARRNPRITPGTIPLLALVATSVSLRPVLPPWAAMWAIAFALFFGCKWLTWRTEAPAAVRGSLRHAIGYLFLWTGMDPAAFLRRNASAHSPAPHTRWLAPLAHMLGGVALVWGVARLMLPANPLLAGWAGMVGLVLLLHFGVFDLIALAWRSRGFNAQPLMNAPMRSAGLSDFWSNRWNTAFNHLAGRYLFAPLSRRAGLPVGTLAAFLVSGLVHDLVISVPARAGYGLPTAYFLIQAAGVLLERGMRRRLGGLWRRLVAAAVVIAPLPLLFHEPFVRRVILPFLDVLGAT